MLADIAIKTARLQCCCAMFRAGRYRAMLRSFYCSPVRERSVSILLLVSVVSMIKGNCGASLMKRL